RPDLSSTPAARSRSDKDSRTPHPPQGAGSFAACTYDSPPIGRARGLLALQLAVEKEDGGQLHQVAEAEVDHVQGADPVQGKGALAVGKDGRPQQQKQQQPVGGVGGGVRFQPDGLPALVPTVLGLLEGFQDVEPQGGRQGAEKAEQEKGLFRHGVSSLCAKTWSMETPKASAILNASSSDGVYLYFSIEMTACREMPTRSARSAWVQSRSARRTLRRFSIKVTAPFQNVMGGLHLHCNTCVTFCQERHTKSPCIPKRTQVSVSQKRHAPGGTHFCLLRRTEILPPWPLLRLADFCGA